MRRKAQAAAVAALRDALQDQGLNDQECAFVLVALILNPSLAEAAR